MKFHYPVNCYRVIDGDTIVCVLDLGFRLTHQVSVRIAGVNTPEVRGAEQKDAGITVARFVQRWLANIQADRLMCHSIELDKFAGRIIGDLYDLDDRNGSRLSVELLAAGLAKPWNGEGDKPTWTADELAAIAGAEVRT